MRCYRCMKEFNKEYEICPHCGYIASEERVEPFQLLPGTVLQNRYWIGMMIGFGGFGITYKAYDTKLNVTVAIKEYYPAGRVNRIQGNADVIVYEDAEAKEYQLGLNRFKEEARHLAKFSKHPNIVNVYNYFQENNTGYIVMEFLDGVSMRYFMEANEGKLSVLYAKEIILTIAQALQTLHAAGILHRDVSPDNIFLCGDGKIKLIDFGIAKLSGGKENNRSIIVKPGYAPPEQYQKQSKQGPWTDIYALGATFYRALTGCTPEESIERQKRNTLLKPSNYNAEIPEYIDVAIMKAMALDVEERFSKIDEFVDVLLERKVVRLPEEEKRIKNKRRRFVTIVSSFGMLALFVFLLWGYIQVRQDKHINENIELWICADEEENTEVLENYYKDISDQLICQDYPEVSVTIHVEDEATYEKNLMESFMNGNGPDIFESTDLDDNWLKYCSELTECVNQLNEQPQHYFLRNYKEYFVSEKQIPIGFSLPVQYVIADENGAVLERLSGYSRSTDYNKAKEKIYGSFTKPKDQIEGKLMILPVENMEDQYEFTTLLSVNAASKKEDQRIAMLYLQYLLSYRGQMLLHAQGIREGVKESEALSVNFKADKEYRSAFCKEFMNIDRYLDKLQ